MVPPHRTCLRQLSENFGQLHPPACGETFLIDERSSRKILQFVLDLLDTGQTGLQHQVVPPGQLSNSLLDELLVDPHKFEVDRS
jgi:hypothetical protein